MKIVSKYLPLKHYKWGRLCDGWNLVDEADLSIKLERMPPGTAEEKHYHRKAQQFFYILKGIAILETDYNTVELMAGEGVYVPAGRKHKISNQTTQDLEFLLCSQPSTAHDRINCDE
ncbi:MAG: cupin domain-containing protein [Flavisolibacter sp.]|nr:cupin domain-containing protein [Flavisolibacter sp.]